MFSGFFQKLGIGGKDEKDEANHYSGLENVFFSNSKISLEILAIATASSNVCIFVCL
jgi:hypothetical protein